MSQVIFNVESMISPWDFIDPALDGVFGRWIRLVSKVTVIGFLVVGCVWHEPLYWLVHQLANWQLSKFRPLLWQIYRQIPQFRVPTSVPRIP